jgi:hypothetical protein
MVVLCRRGPWTGRNPILKRREGLKVLPFQLAHSHEGLIIL